MAKEILLPQLGQTMEEGTIVNVLIKVGDQITKGDVIFEVETDKATLEMESPEAGFVKKILVEQGQTIPVDSLMVIVGDEDEEVGDVVAAVTAAPAAAPAGADGECESAKVILLPQLGQTMEEGTIVSILIAEGDEVKKGDVILEVETDKATLEMESPEAGFVKKVLIDAGQTIPVDAPVVILADKDAEVSQAFVDSVIGGGAAVKTAEPTPAPAAPAPAVAPAPAPAPVAPAPVAEKAGRVFASPRAKMVAKELGVNLATVTAGNGVRITEADVRKAGGGAAGPKTIVMEEPEYKLGDKVQLTKMQKIVGKRMVQSKQEIPCFYLSVVTDMTELMKTRSKLNAAGDVKISFNDFIIRAIGLALKQYPIMAGQVDGDFVKIADRLNVGLAIAVTDGLVAPMVTDADKKSITEVAAYSQQLIAKAKSGKLMPDDLSGGCITLSNLGSAGIDSFIPIVVPGQCSILGVGTISDMCVPKDGGILIRKLMKMTLSVDHKVANGAYAARFLDYIRKLLEDVSTFA